MIRLHPHALARMQERGASREEVEETVRQGEVFTAKLEASARTLHSTAFGTTGVTETSKLKPMQCESRTERTL
jgi:hypothetical protein